MREMIAAITRDDFRRWRDDARHLAPRRTALLTGFPRSGTTLLEQLLDAHPDLVSSEERDFIGREMFHSVAYRRGNTPLLEVINELTDRGNRPPAAAVLCRDGIPAGRADRRPACTSTRTRPTT